MSVSLSISTERRPGFGNAVAISLLFALLFGVSSHVLAQSGDARGMLAAMADNPGQTMQGAGCGAAPTGPVPLSLDLNRHRRTQP